MDSLYFPFLTGLEEVVCVRMAGVILHGSPTETMVVAYSCEDSSSKAKGYLPLICLGETEAP